MFQFKTLRNSTINEKGNQLLSVPKGIWANEENLHLLRYKQEFSLKRGINYY